MSAIGNWFGKVMGNWFGRTVKVVIKDDEAGGGSNRTKEETELIFILSTLFAENMI